MKNIIVIAPIFLHQKLLSEYRKDDPFSHVKVISKEELIGMFFGKYKKDAIIYFMDKYNYSYDVSKTILRYLPLINNGDSEKTATLIKVKNELTSFGYIVKNEYSHQMFINNEVLIHGYSPLDIELNNVLKILDISPNYDLNTCVEKTLTLTAYKQVDEEVLFVLNNIASLIDNKVTCKDIIIIYKDPIYLYYVKDFAPRFNLPLIINESSCLFDEDFSSEFFKKYEKEAQIDDILSQLDEIYHQESYNKFKDIIRGNYYDNLPHYKQRSLYVGLLKEAHLDVDLYDNAIKVSDSLIEQNNAHVFLLGFTQGNYPKAYKDNDFLSDIEKAKNSINTSIIKTQISSDLLVDYLSRLSNVHLSYSKNYYGEEYYPSSLIEELHMDVVDAKLPDTIYSSFMADYLFAKEVDLQETYYEISNDYKTLSTRCQKQEKYHNEFTGVNIKNNLSKERYSYSSIKTYYSCPFSFYLNKVLGLQEDLDDNFNVKIGNLFHKVLQESFEDGFDFETSFQNTISSMHFSVSEMALVSTRLKTQLQLAVQTSLLHFNSYMKNPRVFMEKSCEFYLNHNTSIYGIIDKAIIIDDKYLFLVDYKTGSEKFNASLLDFGQSLQLPTYMVLASDSQDFKQYEVKGIYINNIIDNSTNPKPIGDNLLPQYLKLNGKTIADAEIIGSFDTTYDGNVASFINGIKLVKSTGSLGSGTVSQEELNYYKEKAITKFKEVDTKIRHNEFDIAPVFVGSTDPCKYCPYKDICFKKPEQEIRLSKKEAQENDEMV